MNKIIRSFIPVLRSPTRSLSMKLGIGILLMVVPIFVLSLGILFLQSRYFIREEASERASSLLNTTMQSVRSYMSRIETATNASMWLIEENFDPDSLPSISHRIVELNRHVNGCAISVEPNYFPQCGRLFSVFSAYEGDSIVTVRDLEYDYLEKVWYKTVLDLGKACWIDPFNEYAEDVPHPSEVIATYCKPIRLNGGQIAGVISTGLSFRRLAETINGAGHPYPNAYFILIGGDGRYFIHPDTTRLFRKTIFTETDDNQQSHLNILGQEMTAGKQGSMHLTIDKKLCHVCYRPVSGTNWSIALICPESDILKSYHQLTYIIIALIIVGLLLILVLCRRAVNHAIAPLYRLLNISQKITDGNYEEHILKTDRKDVIGQLQNSFAIMLESLYLHMGIVRHTTERVQQSNEELIHATQLTEEAFRQKNLFIQNVSHQIRTPLNIILGFAEVLRNNLYSLSSHTAVQDILKDEEVTNITSMMEHNASHLNRMVLMLFDSSDTGIFVEHLINRNDQVSCNELAQECISFTTNRFPNISVHFTTDLPDDFCIQTNHLYLMRTLRELLYNSAKYSDKKHISLHLSQTEVFVRFTVEDVGPGLSEDSYNLIFNPFSKVDDLSEGLGLGLSLCKRHAVNLGGDLIFDSDYHDGCRFIIEMPKH